MSTLCYLNGKFLPAEKGAIGISDLGLQRGYGVFEYARTYHRKLFHFDDHLLRFRHSASALHLTLPLPDEEITAIAEHLIQESELDHPAVRLILTGGYAGADFPQHPNFVIIAEELPTYPAAIYSQGVKLILVEYQRELPDVKTLNYMNALRLEPYKREKDAFDILYHADQGISECPRSNFFTFKGDKLVTPASHILPGITRQIVLDLAAAHFPIETREIRIEELAGFDEAFVTSTSKEVLPVTAIDGQPLGSGAVGERTKSILQLFEAYTAERGSWTRENRR